MEEGTASTAIPDKLTFSFYLPHSTVNQKQEVRATSISLCALASLPIIPQHVIVTRQLYIAIGIRLACQRLPKGVVSGLHRHGASAVCIPKRGGRGQRRLRRINHALGCSLPPQPRHCWGGSRHTRCEHRARAAQVDLVLLPSTTGDFGVMPGHVPTVAQLRPGVITVHKELDKVSSVILASFTTGGCMLQPQSAVAPPSSGPWRCPLN